MAHTYNTLVGKMAQRAKELADMAMDDLRRLYPETTETPQELVRLCKQQRLSRGKLIEVILYEEFEVEFDCEMDEGEDHSIGRDEFSAY
jgi:hypothetical protein